MAACYWHLQGRDYGPSTCCRRGVLRLRGHVCGRKQRGRADHVQGEPGGHGNGHARQPPIASVLIEATGNATKLGRFTLEVPHVVNQAVRVGAGSYIFTAANGDTLTASFTGVGTLIAPGVLSTTETATITGGTAGSPTRPAASPLIARSSSRKAERSVRLKARSRRREKAEATLDSASDVTFSLRVCSGRRREGSTEACSCAAR